MRPPVRTMIAVQRTTTPLGRLYSQRIVSKFFRWFNHVRTVVDSRNLLDSAQTHSDQSEIRVRPLGPESEEQMQLEVRRKL